MQAWWSSRSMVTFRIPLFECFPSVFHEPLLVNDAKPFFYKTSVGLFPLNMMIFLWEFLERCQRRLASVNAKGKERRKSQ